MANGLHPILFVDDEASVRETFSKLGKRLGYEVHMAECGASALELARENSYSVVITDLNMPGLDGLALIERLRGRLKSAQFIVVSGDQNISIAREDSSILDVLEKPISFRDLERSLVIAAALFEKRERARVLAPRFLLVEDDYFDSLLVRERLNQELPLAELDWVETLTEAEHAVHQGDFSAVICDLNLPDARGLESVARLRQLAPKLPLVVFSGIDEEATAVEALKFGAQDYLLKDELHKVHLGRLLKFALERKRCELRLEELAYYDQMTGVPNRSLFKDRVGHALARAKRENTQLALMFCDLDRFKLVNDTLGHQTGDRVLKEAARRLCRAVRECDTVARLGGDEFAVLLERTSDADEVVRVAQRILTEISLVSKSCDIEIEIGTSLGVAFYPRHGFTTEGLLKAADIALYEAKGSGRGCFRFFKSGERHSERTGFRRALFRGHSRKKSSITAFNPWYVQEHSKRGPWKPSCGGPRQTETR